jgi:hypothetical protein
MHRIFLGVAFALVVASPGFAQSSNIDPGMARGVRPFVAPAGLMQPGLRAQVLPGAERDAAVAACNDEARRASQSTWGHQELDIYRSCMSRRGQME